MLVFALLQYPSASLGRSATPKSLPTLLGHEDIQRNQPKAPTCQPGVKQSPLLTFAEVSGLTLAYLLTIFCFAPYNSLPCHFCQPPANSTTIGFGISLAIPKSMLSLSAEMFVKSLVLPVSCSVYDLLSCATLHYTNKPLYSVS